MKIFIKLQSGARPTQIIDAINSNMSIATEMDMTSYTVFESDDIANNKEGADFAEKLQNTLLECGVPETDFNIVVKF